MFYVSHCIFYFLDVVVDAFIAERFQMIYVLNKSDISGDTDKNIARIFRKLDGDRCVVASALAEYEKCVYLH